MDTARAAIKAARAVGQTTVWAGNMGTRYFNSSYRGVCILCNNLQPHGHEDTLGRTQPPWKKKAPSYASDVPSLVLEDISTKKLLECFETDSKTGKLKNPCPYCRLLCDIFDAFFIDQWMSWRTETMSAMGLTVGFMIREGAPLIINCWRFTYDSGVQDPRVDLEMYFEKQAHSQPLDAPTIGPAGMRAVDSSIEYCATFIKDCIRQCRAEHPKCNNEKSTFKPTRLLSLGVNDDDIRLIETTTADVHVEWAALSHCWGESRPLKLLRENLEVLSCVVPYDTLPATFRNAIAVSRELGVSCLWIDSLCIIQDDNEDWQKEAAQMGQIYSHASIVISGASSKNPETPFLAPREEEWLPKRFQFTTKSGQTVPITVRRRHMLAPPLEQGLYDPPFTGSWATLKREGPLYKRAWCFQEAHLATRILHFAPGSIIFECQTHRRSEDQLPPYPLVYEGTLGPVRDDQKWQMLVKSYTARQLTFASDRLPAVSGIAASMPQAGRGEYLGGLWKENLPLDLLWQVMPGGSHNVLTYPVAEQAAPSWSWASVNRGVTWNPLKDATPVVKVTDARANVVGANPYGHVKGAVITLTGRLKPCWISYDSHDAHPWVFFRKADGKMSEKKHFVPDGLLMPHQVTKNDQVKGYWTVRARGGTLKTSFEAEAIFLCVAKTPWLNFNHVGILISPSPFMEGAWGRIGNVTNLPKEWYDGEREGSVALI